MADKRLRILLVGGDTALWVGLSATLGERSSQIFVPRTLDEAALVGASSDIDVVVVVTSQNDPDPCEPLRVIRAAGLQNKAMVLADGGDQRTAAEALALGIAGYITRGASPEHLVEAITHIADGGAMFDAPAADVLGSLATARGDAPGLMASARALASALELKDTYTGGHAERVTALAIRLARAAMLEGAEPSEALEAAFLLHDVGKIGIPDSILTKAGGLTDTERRVLNIHPILGERIVAPLGFPDCVRQVIRHHHERWDGRGYPDGLAGSEIPAPARVFAIADVIDAMTSIRPYRKPVSFEEAVHEVILHAGTQFDPALAALAEETFLDAPVQVLDTRHL